MGLETKTKNGAYLLEHKLAPAHPPRLDAEQDVFHARLPEGFVKHRELSSASWPAEEEEEVTRWGLQRLSLTRSGRPDQARVERPKVVVVARKD